MSKEKQRQKYRIIYRRVEKSRATVVVKVYLISRVFKILNFNLCLRSLLWLSIESQDICFKVNVLCWSLFSMAWCKSGTRTSGPGTRDPLKFKSGTLIIIFLHCLTYFVLDEYIYNKEIIFHEYAIFFVLNSSTIFAKSLMSHLVCLICWGMERSMQLVWRPTYPTIPEIKQFHLPDVPLV